MAQATKTFLVTSDIGQEFSFFAKDEKEAHQLINRWATKHSKSGDAYQIEDITGQQTNLLHNEYVR